MNCLMSETSAGILADSPLLPLGAFFLRASLWRFGRLEAPLVRKVSPPGFSARRRRGVGGCFSSFAYLTGWSAGMRFLD